MAFVRTEIPLNNNFIYTAENASRLFSYDYVTPNLKIVAWVETPNRIYIGAYQYDDIRTSANYTVLRQELIVQFPISLTGGIIVRRLNDTTVVLVADRYLYVIEYDINTNNFTILDTEVNFFVHGGLALAHNIQLTWEAAYQADAIYLRNIFDNEFYYVEWEVASLGLVTSGTGHIYRFYRVTFNILTNEISRTLIRTFSNGVNLPSGFTGTQSKFNVNLERIPGTNNIYFCLALSRNTSGSSNNTNGGFDTYVQYSAILDNLGNELSNHSTVVPGIGSSFTGNMGSTEIRYAVALTNDLVIFMSRTSNHIYTWYQGEVTRVSDTMLRFLPNSNFAFYVIQSILPLDANHFIVYWSQVESVGNNTTDYITVCKVITKELIVAENVVTLPVTIKFANRFDKIKLIYDDLLLVNYFINLSNTNKVTHQEVKVRAYE